MCGIYGVVVRPGAAIDPARVAAMGAALAHRGPDDAHVWHDGTAALGATRLSIIDVEGGRQPVTNEDGSIVACQNGELYNYGELRHELAAAGHRFDNRGDTDLLPHLYEADGLDFPRRLRGMFAVALWDAPRGRLVLARDRLGIKPLHYAETADGLWFASEIKAILAAGVHKALDAQALHDFLSLDYVPGPATMFAGVRKLAAGTMLVWDAAAPRGPALGVRRWWSLPAQYAASTAGQAAGGDGGPPLPRSEDGLVALVRTALEDAVSAHLVSDVPVGAFLSGGIDSSIVVALMQRLSGRVETFSVGFDDKSYDELPFARRVAAHCGTVHHETVVRPAAADLVRALVDAFDEPFADSSAIGSWIVAREAAGHTKVVLSGDGGDEVFGGYVIYQADRMAAIGRRMPSFLTQRVLPAIARAVPASDRKMALDLRLQRFARGVALDPLAAHLAWREIFTEETKATLYAAHSGTGVASHADADRPSNLGIDPASNARVGARHAVPTLANRPTLDLLRAAHDAYPHADPINRLMAVDASISLVDDMLTKVDRTSMAHSLEVRVPLLDHPLVELLARIPDVYKVRPIHRGMALKPLLRRVAADLLPRDIVHRPKAGFHVPIPAWLKGELRPLLTDVLAPERVRRQGVFDPAAVEALVRAHLDGRRNLSRELWGLMMFGLWYDRHLS